MKEKSNKATIFLVLAIAIAAIIVVIRLVNTVVKTKQVIEATDEAKISTIKVTAMGYIDAVEKYIILSSVDSDNYLKNGVYQVKELDVKTYGTVPNDGCITITDGNVTDYSLKIENYIVNKKENIQEIIRNGKVKKCS